MPPPLAADEPLDPVERLFLEFLAAQERDGAEEFEAFVARHPDHAAALRRMQADWLEAARVLPSAKPASSEPPVAPPPAPAEPLRIESDEESLRLEFAGDLVRRLLHHRGPSDRYELRAEIGRGGMGAIWKVHDPHLRRRLAMKVILARRGHASAADRSRAMHRALARFLQEAQITSQLEHPGIVPVHDLGIDHEGRVYFTMRLVRGRDLRALIHAAEEDAEVLPRAKALGVLIKVCEAVAYAHSRDVIHRDLKPANVMVGPFGEVYVMDWGLARVVGHDDAHAGDLPTGDSGAGIWSEVREFSGKTPGSPLLTRDGQVLGTPHYMAPEQVRGRIGEVGKPADVYALGAMLYELLAGRPPYSDASEQGPIAIAEAVEAGPPTPLAERAPDVPAELAAICAKAMHRRPSKRYATPLELAREVERYLDHRPVEAHLPSVAHVVRLAIERNQSLAATLAAAVVVLSSGGSFAWWKHREQQAEVQAKEREVATLGGVGTAIALAGAPAPDLPCAPASRPQLELWLELAQRVVDDSAAQAALLEQSRAAGDAAQVALLEQGAAATEQLRDSRIPWMRQWSKRIDDVERISLRDSTERWDAARRAIAASPRYGGRELAPQLGLVPLREDPASGLWEFWHVASGSEPRLPSDGAGPYEYADDAGIVLVLIPGGEHEIGRARPPGAVDRRGRATLAPYFIAKHELTQAQYVALMGENPSTYSIGRVTNEADVKTGRPPLAVTGRHPVEGVSWTDGARLLRRAALRYPTLAEWEVAGRGGGGDLRWWDEGRALVDEGGVASGTPWDGFAGGQGRENLVDESTDRNCGPWEGVAKWDDGWPRPAPVGTFAANGFGLHDVLGNVSEWVVDPRRSSDGRVTWRYHAGGNWSALFPEGATLTFPSWLRDHESNSSLGLRAARDVE
ncbi:MAG: SUMF1/EgtB/PvdO family nonheme iron enzyme [Planctomycetes bacterium]|nr:SUMF1/EgtB/PvdO family nonheme iron enzyme [Planctomycetota bacterium]